VLTAARSDSCLTLSLLFTNGQPSKECNVYGQPNNKHCILNVNTFEQNQFQLLEYEIKFLNLSPLPWMWALNVCAQ